MITCHSHETNIQDIPEYVFPSQLVCVVFPRLDYVNWHFKLFKGSEVIVEEDYVCDRNGDVRVYGIDEVVRSTLDVGQLAGYTIEMYDSTESKSGFTSEFTAVWCDLDLNIDALTFLQNFFLSPIQSKVTEMGRIEQISYFRLYSDTLPSTGILNVTAEYLVDDTVKTKSFSLGSVGFHDTQSATADVSPKRFLVDGMQLISYTVTLDNRSFTFTMGEAETPGFGFLFRNCFGCQDTFYCMGEIETDPQFERLSGRFGYRTLVYAPQETFERVAHSGEIPDGMVALFDDLVRATEVYTIDDGREVCITDSDTGRTDDISGYASGSITFRPSGRYAPLQYQIPGRIFDDTFDNTFN